MPRFELGTYRLQVGCATGLRHTSQLGAFLPTVLHFTAPNFPHRPSFASYLPGGAHVRYGPLHPTAPLPLSHPQSSIQVPTGTNSLRDVASCDLGYGGPCFGLSVFVGWHE